MKSINKMKLLALISLLVTFWGCPAIVYSQDKLGITSIKQLPELVLKYENEKYLTNFLNDRLFTVSNYEGLEKDFKYTLEVKSNKKLNYKEYKCSIDFLKDGIYVKRFSKAFFYFFNLNGKIYVTQASYSNYNVNEVAKNYLEIDKEKLPVSDFSATYYFINSSKKLERFSLRIECETCSIKNDSLIIKDRDSEEVQQISTNLYPIVTKNIWVNNGYVFNPHIFKNKIDTTEFYKIKNKYTDGKYVSYVFIKSYEKFDSVIATAPKYVRTEKGFEIDSTGNSDSTNEMVFAEDEETRQRNEKLKEDLAIERKFKSVEEYYANGRKEGIQYEFNNSFREQILNPIRGGYSLEKGYLDSTYLSHKITYKNGRIISEIDYKLVYVESQSGSYSLKNYISEQKLFDENRKKNGLYFQRDDKNGITYFIQNGNYKNDKMDGLWEFYHSNSGKLRYKTTYVDGKPIGITETYNEEGELISKTIHKD